MIAEIISVGTELLQYRIVNTNAAHIAQSLSEIGIELGYHVTVGDETSRIVEALRSALRRSDVVITVGGLGQGTDDMTGLAIAKYLGYADADCLAAIPETRAFAGQPGCGGYVELAMGTIICLPGQPRQMSYLLDTDVLPFLLKSQGVQENVGWSLLHTAGLMESKLKQLLANVTHSPDERISFSTYAGQTDIRVWVQAPTAGTLRRRLRNLKRRVTEQLGDHVYGTDKDRLESVLLDSINTASLRLLIAECHTQGTVGRVLAVAAGGGDEIKAMAPQTIEKLSAQTAVQSLDPATGDLTAWCRQVVEKLRLDQGYDLALLVYKHVQPGGVQLIATLAAPDGETVMQRSFGGHPPDIEDWAATVGMVHVRRWLLAHETAVIEPALAVTHT